MQACAGITPVKALIIVQQRQTHLFMGMTSFILAIISGMSVCSVSDVSVNPGASALTRMFLVARLAAALRTRPAGSATIRIGVDARDDKVMGWMRCQLSSRGTCRS